MRSPDASCTKHRWPALGVASPQGGEVVSRSRASRAVVLGSGARMRGTWISDPSPAPCSDAEGHTSFSRDHHHPAPRDAAGAQSSGAGAPAGGLRGGHASARARARWRGSESKHPAGGALGGAADGVGGRAPRRAGAAARGLVLGHRVSPLHADAAQGAAWIGRPQGADRAPEPGHVPHDRAEVHDGGARLRSADRAEHRYREVLRAHPVCQGHRAGR